MPHAPPSGVLILDADASVQHVDDATLSSLEIDRASLFDGSAALLRKPVTDGEGATHSSLEEYLEHFLASESPVQLIQLPNGTWAEARVAHGPAGPTGCILTLCEKPPTMNASEETVDEAHRRRAPRLRSEQNRLLESIATGTPLPEVLTELIAFIEAERPGMVGSVLLLDPETQTLHHGAAPSLPDSYVEAIDGLPVGPSYGSCGSAVYYDDLVVADDLQTEDQWEDCRKAALDHGFRACWSVPIHGEDDEILGTVALYADEPQTPTEQDRILIAEASHLAGVAIEHDRQKQALQLQEEQFQRLVENAQPIVFFLDPDGTFLLSEGEDLEALGLQPGEAVGASVYDLYSDHPTLLHYVDRALDGETVDATIEMDDAVLDIWFSPYYNRAGHVAGCLGMAVDITERRTAEAALRANRDLLRRTQEMAHVGGWEYDAQFDTMIGTEVTYRIFEVPLNTELSLEQSLSFYPPDFAEKMRDAAARCLEHGDPFDLEGPMVTDEETQRWVRVRGEPRRHDDGTITKMVGTVQDLTERHEIEDRLREQKEWLQSITENISGGIYRSTEEGLVYANQAFLDLFGYNSLNEITAVDPRSLYADPSVRADLLRRENEQNGLDGVEVEYQRKDGSTFTGLLRSTQVLGPGGTPHYYDGVVTDITEQKTRERKFREQRRTIEAMYKPSGRLLQASNREEVASLLVSLLADAFGYPGVVVRGVQEHRLVPLSADLPAADVEPLSLSLDEHPRVAKIFLEGDTCIIDDVQGLNDSIDWEPAESIAAVPLGNHGLLTLASVQEEGFDTFDLRLIDILAQKVTAVLDRIEQEKHLRASEERFRGLFEEAALGIALLDAEGVIVKANPELASMLGYKTEALRDRPLSDLTPPEDSEEARALFDDLVTGERQRYEVEKQYVRRDGTTFWGRVTMSQHKGPGEAEVIGMIEDVSSRRQYEQQLKEAKQKAEEASRLKSALLANMSHEIRTPLTSIIGFTGVLIENLSGQNARYAGLAHAGGKRLMETLDSVLQLSKLEAGVTEPDAKRIELTETVRETIALYQSEAQAAGVDFQFDSAVDCLHGTWAPTALQRVLSNLLSNAIKFTPEGGTVTVRILSSDETAILEVEDTGKGISDEFRPRLFTAFTQESEGLKREHEGSGLGLAIAKRLVDLLEGEIQVESTKGEGTCFTVRLPR